MAHVGERLELERAFSGATVHDMFPGDRRRRTKMLFKLKKCGDCWGNSMRF
jgi:hypothetical protein